MEVKAEGFRQNFANTMELKDCCATILESSTRKEEQRQNICGPPHSKNLWRQVSANQDADILQ